MTIPRMTATEVRHWCQHQRDMANEFLELSEIQELFRDPDKSVTTYPQKKSENCDPRWLPPAKMRMFWELTPKFREWKDNRERELGLVFEKPVWPKDVHPDPNLYDELHPFTGGGYTDAYRPLADVSELLEWCDGWTSAPRSSLIEDGYNWLKWFTNREHFDKFAAKSLKTRLHCLREAIEAVAFQDVAPQLTAQERTTMMARSRCIEANHVGDASDFPESDVVEKLHVCLTTPPPGPLEFYCRLKDDRWLYLCWDNNAGTKAWAFVSMEVARAGLIQWQSYHSETWHRLFVDAEPPTPPFNSLSQAVQGMAPPAVQKAEAPRRVLKEPKPEAIAAYRLSMLGWKQQPIADQLTKEFRQPFPQWKVSRLLTGAKDWLEAGNVFPPLSEAKPATAVDPVEIDKGARQDHQTPRQRHRQSSDE